MRGANIRFSKLPKEAATFLELAARSLPQRDRIHYNLGLLLSYLGEAANADPNGNPDGDSDLNIVEWLTGFDPNDPGSFFTWFVDDKSGNTVNVIANKVIPGTIYRLQSTLDLENGPWADVVTDTPVAETVDQLLPAPNGVEAARWYRFTVEAAP